MWILKKWGQSDVDPPTDNSTMKRGVIIPAQKSSVSSISWKFLQLRENTLLLVKAGQYSGAANTEV